MNPEPSYLTSPDEALARVEKMEAALLDAADAALFDFLQKVIGQALNGGLTRAGVLENWKLALYERLSHPAFAEVRDELIDQLDNLTFADDVYTAAEMALEVAHNMSATPQEREEVVRGTLALDDPSLIASLSARVDAWLRKRISKLLLKRIRTLGPEDLEREDLLGREFQIPEEPGPGSAVTEADWATDEERPGDINWRARMRRDIRTAYTAIFGRQMQRQLERYGYLEKKWISRKDDRVRHTHVLADGQSVSIYGVFTVGGFPLKYPGDPMGPPQEVINCRCCVVGVPGSKSAL